MQIFCSALKYRVVYLKRTIQMNIKYNQRRDSLLNWTPIIPVFKQTWYTWLNVQHIW